MTNADIKLRYRILIDSCGELTEKMKADPHFVSIPLTLRVDEREFVDDSTFNQAEFLSCVRASPNVPSSACPSPDDYLSKIIEEGQDVYIITLSDKLSASHNSADLAIRMFKEERGDSKNLHLFNSRSASIAQTLIAMKVQELAEQGLPFETVVAQTEQYIGDMHTYFVLETLEALRKNGRISNLKATFATILRIKPVMGADREGYIHQLANARGMKKALESMANFMIEQGHDLQNKILAISHCNAPDMADYLKQFIEKSVRLKDIIILNTAGVSSLYASEGGVIMAV